MTEKQPWPVKAYRNRSFMGSREARHLRIASEYIEPESRFEELQISDTIVFFGSARTLSPKAAKKHLKETIKRGRGIKDAERKLAASRYYNDARQLAKRLTEWSKGLEKGTKRFVVCTGGGPGIMEAANLGASQAKGMNIGLNIALPFEQQNNHHITRKLAFEFNYFFMRKFWFTYLAKALVIFPGGFGTMDEFFELMTLIQTRKLKKKMAIVLYGNDYWNEVINFDAMVRHGVISASDLKLFSRADSPDQAYEYITQKLIKTAIKKPGGSL